MEKWKVLPCRPRLILPLGYLATGSKFWRPLNSTDLPEREKPAQGSQVSVCLKISLQAKSEIPSRYESLQLSSFHSAAQASSTFEIPPNGQPSHWPPALPPPETSCQSLILIQPLARPCKIFYSSLSPLS